MSLVGPPPVGGKLCDATWGQSLVGLQEAVVQTPTPRPALDNDSWHAAATAVAMSSRHTTPSRRALKSVHAGDLGPRSGTSLRSLARGARPVRPLGCPAGGPLPFVAFGHDGVGTDAQDPCGIATPTGMHRHRNAWLLHRRRLASLARVQEEDAPCAPWLATAVALLALPRLATAADISPVAVGTVDNLEHQDVARAR
jgi:hypothetical protein